MKISARNVLQGTVASITKGAVNSEVTLSLLGGSQVVSVVTNAAIDTLGLKQGASAFAIIKATSVIVGSDLHDAKVSARNVMCGTVKNVIEGPVSAEVDVEIGGGTTISAVITHESSTSLGMKAGTHACVMFKASSVMLGVS